MLIRENGTLAPRIVNDPRWSAAQREAAVRAADADPLARAIGFDQKMRPVLVVTLAGQRGEYALLRNGDPAKPVLPRVESWR